MTTKRKKQFGVKELEQRYGGLTIARFLRSWRLSEDLSQVEFGGVIGISAQNLSDIENGRKGVSIEKAYTIAEAIGYSPAVLVKLVLQEQIDTAGLSYSVDLKKRVA